MLQEQSIEASLYRGKKGGLRLEGHHSQQDLFNKQVKWDLEDRMFTMIFNTKYKNQEAYLHLLGVSW